MQLQVLKKAFDLYQHNQANHHTLLSQREQTIQKMLELKEAIERKHIKLHSLSKKELKTADELRLTIAEESEIVAQLQETIKELDSLLDTFEQNLEDDKSQLQQTLIDSILRQFPQASQEYYLIKESLDSRQQQWEDLIKEKKHLTPFFNALYEGAHITLKGGFFTFLLGQHPKIILAQYIHKTASLAKSIYDDIKDERFKNFLDMFIKETEKPWNKHLYKGKLTYLFDEFSALYHELEEQINQLKQQIMKEEENLELWLEKYCSEYQD